MGVPRSSFETPDRSAFATQEAWFRALQALRGRLYMIVTRGRAEGRIEPVASTRLAEVQRELKANALPRKRVYMQRRMSFDAMCEPQENGCAIWRGAMSKSTGYGVLMIDRRKSYAHRYAWERVHGPIAKGLVICHTCDVRLCVNPEHMFLGTPADNARDMWSKGRGRPPEPRLGEEHHAAKLTCDLVDQVRARLGAGERGRRIAADLGVSESTISVIKHKKVWRHTLSNSPAFR